MMHILRYSLLILSLSFFLWLPPVAAEDGGTNTAAGSTTPDSNKFTCSTLSGAPNQSEFVTEDPAPSNAAAQALLTSVDNQIKAIYDGCRTNTTPGAGWEKRTLQLFPDNKESSTAAATEVWIKSTSLTKGQLPTTPFSIYIANPADPRWGHSYSVSRKQGSTPTTPPSDNTPNRPATPSTSTTEQYYISSGHGYESFCQSQIRKMNNQLAEQRSRAGQTAPAAGQPMAADQRQALYDVRQVLLPQCVTQQNNNPNYGKFGSIFGKDIAAIQTAVTNMTISCNQLFELQSYGLGQLCLDDQSNYTFSTQRIGSSLGIEQLIGRFMGLLAASIGSVAMLVMMIGGFLMITAGPNEDMITRGKQAFSFGLISIVIVFSAYLIVVFVQSLFFG